jgi:hypothetical protein
VPWVLTSLLPAIVTGDDHDTFAASPCDATNAALAATATAIVVDPQMFTSADDRGAPDRVRTDVFMADFP